jgi:endonuclease-3 related protein
VIQSLARKQLSCSPIASTEPNVTMRSYKYAHPSLLNLSNYLTKDEQRPLKETLPYIYKKLFLRYGPQHWWPGDGAFEVIVGAILTQAASWNNVSKAIANLKAACLLEPAALRAIDQQELAGLIRSSVYFNAKAQKLKAFVQHLSEHYNDDLEALLKRDSSQLRQELLSIYGIGEETADDIVLYAARKPIFVIDAYTRRILGRLGLVPARETYGSYQAIFMDNLPNDTDMFNEFHALLDQHAAETCRKNRPRCGECCLLDICPTGATITA